MSAVMESICSKVAAMYVLALLRIDWPHNILWNDDKQLELLVARNFEICLLSQVLAVNSLDTVAFQTFK